MVLTMLVISILVFFVAEVVPIDPARNALGRYASQKKVDELREKMGLDRPVVVRYVDWISKAVRGDFGESIHFRRPVADLIAVRLERSLILAALGFAFMIPIGLALGCIAGIHEGKLLDRIISLTGSLFVSIPPFANRAARGWNAGADLRGGVVPGDRGHRHLFHESAHPVR